MAFLRRISGKHFIELSEKEAADLKGKEGDTFTLHTGPKGIFLIEPVEGMEKEFKTGTMPSAMTMMAPKAVMELTQPLMDKAVIKTNSGALLPASEKSSYLLSKSGFLFTKNESKANAGINETINPVV